MLPPVPALQQWLAEHMNAAIRDLLSADPPEVVVFPATATAHATAPPATIRTLFTASGTLPAKPKRSLLDGLSPGQILAIVLIWVIAYLAHPPTDDAGGRLVVRGKRRSDVGIRLRHHLRDPQQHRQRRDPARTAHQSDARRILGTRFLPDRTVIRL